MAGLWYAEAPNRVSRQHKTLSKYVGGAYYPDANAQAFFWNDASWNDSIKKETNKLKKIMIIILI